MNNWPEKYLGIPWLTGGRNIAFGLDCWGLLRHVYAVEFGIAVTEHAVPLGVLANPHEVTYAQKSGGYWLETTAPSAGDVVALGRMMSSFSHVGIYVLQPKPALLHSIEGAPSCVTTLAALYRQGYSNIKFYRHVDSRFSN